MARNRRRALGIAAAVAVAIALSLAALGPCGRGGAPPGRAGAAPDGGGVTEATDEGHPPGSRGRAARPATEAATADDAAGPQGETSDETEEPADRPPLRVLCVHAGTDDPIPGVRIEVRWPQKRPWGRTGPDGVWLAPRPPGPADVVAGEDADVDGVWYEEARLPVAEGAREIRVELSTLGVVSGTVLGPDGTAMVGVGVAAVDPETGHPLRTTESDRSGGFFLPLPEGTRVVLRAQHVDEGFRFLSAPRQTLTATTRGVALRLVEDPLDTAVDVLVVDPDGNPVEGATFSLRMTLSQRSVRIRSGAAAWPRAAAALPSGADGRTRIAGLPRRPVHLTVHPPEPRRPGWISGGAEVDVGSASQVTLRLRAGCVVAGSLVDAEGHAVAGASVTVFDADGRTVADGRSAADGRFSVEVPAGGTEPCRLVARDGRRTGGIVRIDGETEDLRVVLRDGD